jgi:hypothetical protein
MPNYDFGCKQEHFFEYRCHFEDRPDTLPCPVCGESAKPVLLGMPSVFTTIIPSYPGSKRLKAGYQLSHGNHSATKTSSGIGGILQKRDVPEWVKNNVQPEYKQAMREELKR